MTKSNDSFETIDKNTLVDIQEVKIDEEMTTEQRIKSFLQQIKNPYCFMCDGVVVKVKYTNQGNTLENMIKNLILSL